MSAQGCGCIELHASLLRAKCCNLGHTLMRLAITPNSSMLILWQLVVKVYPHLKLNEVFAESLVDEAHVQHFGTSVLVLFVR